MLPHPHIQSSMRYLVLATDYDGTLAAHGKVPASTLESLKRLRTSGRNLILVTGRHLPDLNIVFFETVRETYASHTHFPPTIVRSMGILMMV